MEGGGQVLTALQSLGCSYVIESHAVPRSVIWRRKTSLAPVGEYVSWKPFPFLSLTSFTSPFAGCQVLLGDFIAITND